MRYYPLLREFPKKPDRVRVIDVLQRLRAQLDRDIPGKDSDHHLLLATWNIRDFGKLNRRGFGERLNETHYYLAEIISRFDIVAVQEVNELKEWERLMYILGQDWDFIATGVTDQAMGGNGERLTFVYDRRKVSFKKIMDEIVLPPKLEVGAVKGKGKTVTLRGKQFNRTPFKATFQSGWLKFDLCTVHIYYGADSGAKLVQRVEEIRAISNYLGKQAEEASEQERATFLLGDFNIVHKDHKTMESLKEGGFKIPSNLYKASNALGTKYYDQIAFYEDKGLIDFVQAPKAEGQVGNAGVFDIFEELMREKDYADYKVASDAAYDSSKEERKMSKEKFYMDWRTYQISDHKPMWVRVQVNSSSDYLEELKNREPYPAE